MRKRIPEKLLLFVFVIRGGASASAVAFACALLRVGTAYACHTALFLLVKIEAYRADDGGNYQNDDDIGYGLHYFCDQLSAYSALIFLLVFAMRQTTITTIAATATAPPMVPAILREAGAVMRVPMVLTR